VNEKVTQQSCYIYYEPAQHEQNATPRKQTVDYIMKPQGTPRFDVESATDWLTGSGVQDEKGGFYAWYDTQKQEYSFLYPEITGYAIQILTRLYNQTKKTSHLDKAIKAGNWLLQKQKLDGSFYCKYFPAQQKCDKSFYVFDAGIINCGLMDLYKTTSENKYLRAATKTMNLLLKFQNPDGSFKAGRTPQGNTINLPHWSQTSSCHHLKMLQPLLRLHKITKEQKYLDAATKLLEWGLKLQLPTGRFVTFLGSNNTYTHANCYALEGLVASSEYFDDANRARIFGRLSLGVNWLLNSQNSDGSVWNWNGSHENKVKVNEALAQTIRLAHLTDNFLNQKNDENKLKGLKFIQRMQALKEDKRVKGGIGYAQTPDNQQTHINTCATIFAVHMALLIKNGAPKNLLEEMI
jgi:predicted small secreted protein